MNESRECSPCPTWACVRVLRLLSESGLRHVMHEYLPLYCTIQHSLSELPLAVIVVVLEVVRSQTCVQIQGQSLAGPTQPTGKAMVA